MNISEANAVNTVVRALADIPSPFTGERDTVEQQQAAVDILLRGAHRALGAGLQPGQVTLPVVDR